MKGYGVPENFEDDWHSPSIKHLAGSFPSSSAMATSVYIRLD